MLPEEKIADVLKTIHDEIKISPNPDLVEFNFNDHVVGAGITGGEDERKILLKLHSEKIIKLRIPEDDDAIYRYNYKIEKHIFRLSHIQIEITSNFWDYYNKHKRYLKSEISKNYWNYVNPLWIFWKLIRRAHVFIREHTLVSAIFGGVFIILTLVATDYALAWKNLKLAWTFIKGLLDL
jgi:hypothetical protein